MAAVVITAVACLVLLLALATRLESSPGVSVALFTLAPAGATVALVILGYCARAFDDVLLRWFAAGLTVAVTALLLQLISYPLVSVDGGPLGTSGSGSASLYVLFHLGPAVAAIAAVLHARPSAIPVFTTVGVLAALTFATDLVPLPVMIRPDATFTPLLIGLEWATAACLLVAAALWARTVGRSPSGLHAWVGVFLFVATYDVVFNAIGGARFTSIWWSSLMMRVMSFTFLAGGCLAWVLLSLRASERYGEQEISRREGQLGVAFGLTRRLLTVSDHLSSGISLAEVCERVVELARSGTGVRHVGSGWWARTWSRSARPRARRAARLERQTEPGRSARWCCAATVRR